MWINIFTGLKYTICKGMLRRRRRTSCQVKIAIGWAVNLRLAAIHEDLAEFHVAGASYVSVPICEDSNAYYFHLSLAVEILGAISHHYCIPSSAVSSNVTYMTERRLRYIAC
jgi:hypothetical protein